MDVSTRESDVLFEAAVQAAITEYQSTSCRSIRTVATAFGISDRTLRRRLQDTKSRSMAHEYRQALSPAEKHVLFKWITHLTRTRFPISPGLAQQMAEQIRH